MQYFKDINSRYMPSSHSLAGNPDGYCPWLCAGTMQRGRCYFLHLWYLQIHLWLLNNHNSLFRWNLWIHPWFYSKLRAEFETVIPKKLGRRENLFQLCCHFKNYTQFLMPQRADSWSLCIALHWVRTWQLAVWAMNHNLMAAHSSHSYPTAELFQINPYANAPQRDLLH